MTVQLMLEASKSRNEWMNVHRLKEDRCRVNLPERSKARAMFCDMGEGAMVVRTRQAGAPSTVRDTRKLPYEPNYNKSSFQSAVVLSLLCYLIIYHHDHDKS